MTVRFVLDPNAPVPPRPICVENGGTREEWDEYHRLAMEYYHGISLTIEQIKEIVK